MQPLAYSLWVTVIVVSLSLVGFGSLNAISAWDRKQEFGVHFATGLTKKDLIKLVIYETLWALVIPVVVAAGVFFINHVWQLFDYIWVDTWVLLASGLILTFIAMATTVAPVAFLRSQQTASLIRGLEGESQ